MTAKRMSDQREIGLAHLLTSENALPFSAARWFGATFATQRLQNIASWKEETG
jgi:hypothetical protein